jgi:hypothetical protein
LQVSGFSQSDRIRDLFPFACDQLRTSCSTGQHFKFFVFATSISWCFFAVLVIERIPVPPLSRIFRGITWNRTADADQVCGDVQNAHRCAPIGISLKHSEHLRVVGSAGGYFRALAIRALTGTTTKKYTAAAMIRNESNAPSASA